MSPADASALSAWSVVYFLGELGVIFGVMLDGPQYTGDGCSTGATDSNQQRHVSKNLLGCILWETQDSFFWLPGLSWKPLPTTQ
jgi:hypothetical protein